MSHSKSKKATQFSPKISSVIRFVFVSKNLRKCFTHIFDKLRFERFALQLHLGAHLLDLFGGVGPRVDRVAVLAREVVSLASYLDVRGFEAERQNFLIKCMCPILNFYF